MCYISIILAATLSDQFAYRPTCSTTAALVALDHHVAQYLESVLFVFCKLSRRRLFKSVWHHHSTNQSFSRTLIYYGIVRHGSVNCSPNAPTMAIPIHDHHGHPHMIHSVCFGDVCLQNSIRKFTSHTILQNNPLCCWSYCIVYTVFRKKTPTGPLMFSIITPAFLVDFYTFYTNGKRNEYPTICILTVLMTS